jgi:hypothetical protein
MDESSRPAGNGKTSPELSLYLDSSPLVFSDSLFEPDGGDAIAPYMDIGSDPAEREAIKLARNCERLAAAGPADIFLFAPVYGSDLPHDGVEDRRGTLKGFIRGAFVPGPMITQIFRGVKSRQRLDISFFRPGAGPNGPSFHERPATVQNVQLWGV